MTIKRIQTVISPDILDTIGRSFKFRHGKGIAEWLKNALDSYLRLRADNKESLRGSWPVLINILDGGNALPGPNLVVVDFGGTTFESVREFLLTWGDTTAATHGGKYATTKVTGGHGNGGKFYMREMWKDGARFCTWRNGHITSLVVDRAKPGTTGYWEAQDDACPDWKKALEHALPLAEGLGGAEKIIEQLTKLHPQIRKELEAGKRGFTIIAGKRAVQLWSSNDVVKGKKWDYQKLVDEIRGASQAKRPIRELVITILVNGASALVRFEPEKIPLDAEWPERKLELSGNVIGVSKPHAGTLKLQKAEHSLVGRLSDHNVVTVFDSDKNPIASYRLKELPVPSTAMTTFFLGELILDFSGLSEFVENDREKLVLNKRTSQILDWVGDQVAQLASDIEESEKAKHAKAGFSVASVLNKALNQHAQRFLQEIQTEIMVNYIEDPAGGGPGSEGDGTGYSGGKGGGGGDRGSGGGSGKGGTKETSGDSGKSRRPQFPRVLLSAYDPDPSDPKGGTKILTKAHPPLWQDDSDRRQNVYWINTDHPFASETLLRGGPNGSPFKTHQLFMFRDVVQREALRMLQKREAEIAIDRMETELDDYSNRFLSELSYELVEGLLGSKIAVKKGGSKAS